MEREKLARSTCEPHRRRPAAPEETACNVCERSSRSIAPTSDGRRMRRSKVRLCRSSVRLATDWRTRVALDELRKVGNGKVRPAACLSLRAVSTL